MYGVSTGETRYPVLGLRFTRWSPVCAGMMRSRLTQLCLHESARLGEIHLPGVARFELGHHLAHVLHARRARLGQRIGDRFVEFCARELLRQEFANDDDLLGLLLGEFGAT